MISSVDMITQILYRVPAKSIARFRCVSKEWLSLLTDPQFIKTHQNTLINHNHLIFKHIGIGLLYSHPFHHHEPILTPTKLPFEMDDSIDFHGSCDGLVLVSNYNVGCLDTLVLLNPTTRESVQLPQSGFYHYKMKSKVESTFYSKHGFGYDSVTDDYKVISLTYFHYYMNDDYDYMNDHPTIHVSLYSLRNNTWRRLIDCPYEIHHCHPPPVYVNGFLHWVAYKSDDPWVIVAFSLADECFSEVPLPSLCSNRYDCKLVGFGGKLAMCTIYSLNFEVWLMNEYGVKESWTKIPLDRFLEEIHMKYSMIFYDNGKIRVAHKDVMLIYDYEKRTFSKNAYVWKYKCFELLGSYVESLVSPKRDYTMDAKQIQDAEQIPDSFVDQYTTDAEQIQELADSFMDQWERGLEISPTSNDHHFLTGKEECVFWIKSLGKGE